MNFLLAQAQKTINGLGNSGCKLELLQSNPVSIKKTALSTTYIDRLNKQRIKQQNFWCPIKGIRIPKVLDFDQYSFTMEHLLMLNAIEFFERAEFEVIQVRIKILIDLIHWEIENSIWTEVDKQIFRDKLLAIKSQVSIEIWHNYYVEFEKIFLLHLPKKMPILTGFCHGDLTLSNVMFSMRENQIGLIDFLDNFIDSPLADIAKLLQDARFHWSSYRFPFPHDRGKIRIVNSWISIWVEKEFRQELLTRQFWAVQMMNYFRIIPYIHLPKEHEYIVGILAQTSVWKEVNR